MTKIKNHYIYLLRTVLFILIVLLLLDYCEIPQSNIIPENYYYVYKMLKNILGFFYIGIYTAFFIYSVNRFFYYKNVALILNKNTFKIVKNGFFNKSTSIVKYSNVGFLVFEKRPLDYLFKTVTVKIVLNTSYKVLQKKFKLSVKISYAQSIKNHFFALNSTDIYDFLPKTNKHFLKNTLLRSVSSIEIYRLLALLAAFVGIAVPIIQVGSAFAYVTVVFGLPIAAILTVAFRVIKNTVRFYGFTSAKGKGIYFVSYGLIVNKNIFVPQNKINIFSKKQTFFGKIFGFVFLQIKSGGYSAVGIKIPPVFAKNKNGKFE